MLPMEEMLRQLLQPPLVTAQMEEEFCECGCGKKFPRTMMFRVKLENNVYRTHEYYEQSHVTYFFAAQQRSLQ